MSEEYKNNFVILTDEDGNEKEFEHIDTLEDNGTVYLAFIPAELNLEEEAEVVILKIVEEDGEELLPLMTTRKTSACTTCLWIAWRTCTMLQRRMNKPGSPII